MSSCLVIWLVSGNSSRHSFVERGTSGLGESDSLHVYVCVSPLQIKEGVCKTTKFALTIWCGFNICVCVYLGGRL